MKQWQFSKNILKINNNGNHTNQHKRKHLTKAEIDQLFPLVNGERDWKINVNSYQLVDKLIELWFESQGYDFWNNPFPDVIEWEVTKDNEIIFKYEL